MKRTSKAAGGSKQISGSEDLRSEYKFDYSEARPNRFARGASQQVVVVLDPDVARVFTDPESVNTALRALLSAIPAGAGRRRR